MKVSSKKKKETGALLVTDMYWRKLKYHNWLFSVQPVLTS